MHGLGPRDVPPHRRLNVLRWPVAPSRVIVGRGRGNGRSRRAPPERPAGQGASEGGGVDNDDEAPRRGSAGREELFGDALARDAQHR